MIEGLVDHRPFAFTAWADAAAGTFAAETAATGTAGTRLKPALATAATAATFATATTFPVMRTFALRRSLAATAPLAVLPAFTAVAPLAATLRALAARTMVVATGARLVTGTLAARRLRLPVGALSLARPIVAPLGTALAAGRGRMRPGVRTGNRFGNRLSRFRCTSGRDGRTQLRKYFLQHDNKRRLASANRPALQPPYPRIGEPGRSSASVPLPWCALAKAIFVAVNAPPLLTLVQRRNAPPPPPDAASLFHAALLLPSRAALDASLNFAAAHGVDFGGFSDQGVSEAIYFSDPDGMHVRLHPKPTP
ncbi:MAG: hypothetical protein EXS37_16320 [Opitutus sp.]|nr:hypothetical protein [Opitutus sp.]